MGRHVVRRRIALQKTKSRRSSSRRPVGATPTPRGNGSYRDIPKTRKNGKTEKHPPVGAAPTFLRSSPSLKPAKPVGVSEAKLLGAELMPAAAHGIGHNAGPPLDPLRLPANDNGGAQ
jgi:hypothetical protein